MPLRLPDRLPAIEILKKENIFVMDETRAHSQEIRNRVKRDPHALGKWRVNGALPHIDAWYEAFGVKKGDKLFIPKSERLQLW